MRPSHIDIENRVDDEEEMSSLRVSIHEEEQALDGMMDWADENESREEWEADNGRASERH